MRGGFHQVLYRPIRTDAHSTEELANLESGVHQARRAGLEAKDVANTRSLTQFRKLLKR